MRQVGSVDSYSQCKILASPSVFLSRSWASSDQTTFSQSSAGHFWWACAHCSLTFVFAADRRGAQHGLLPLNTIFILRYFSAHQSLSAFCQLQLVIKGQHLTKKKKKKKKEVKPMPANPGRLVVSEKLKPSGTTSTVSDNSFPLVLVFGIINQLVCAHLYRNPIHLLKHCSRHSLIV